MLSNTSLSRIDTIRLQYRHIFDINGTDFYGFLYGVKCFAGDTLISMWKSNIASPVDSKILLMVNTFEKKYFHTMKLEFNNQDDNINDKKENNRMYINREHIDRIFTELCHSGTIALHTFLIQFINNCESINNGQWIRANTFRITKPQCECEQWYHAEFSSNILKSILIK